MVRPPNSSLHELDLEDVEEEEHYFGDDFTSCHDSSAGKGKSFGP